MTPYSLVVLGRLRYRHLRLVEVLARTQNLHLAASELNLTQPAATKILQDLEEILDVQVFERHSRGMRPTDLGKFVIDYATQVIEDAGRFASRLAFLHRGGQGAVAVGSITGAIPKLIPTIATMKRLRPLLTIDLVLNTSDRLLDALERREIEFALARFGQLRDEVLFSIDQLTTEEFWFFVGPAHRFARATDVALEELSGEPWVLQPGNTPMRQLVDRFFALRNVRAPINLIETTSVFATIELVRTSSWISILPKSLLAGHIERGEFVRVPIQLPELLAGYGIVRRLNEELSADASAFIEVLRGITG